MTHRCLLPMAHPDLSAEQAHVDHAYARLEQMRDTAAGMLRDAFGERGGTFQALTERDIRVRSSLGRLEQLQLGAEALVFGRIDRRPSDGEPEAFHIGRLAVSDADQEPLVVDWRAPVAEPFYRATGAHPMGLERRRHFLAEGRRIADLEDELFGVEGDDDGVGLGLSGPQVLLSAISRGRTGRMRDIVATVQREQDEVIRSPLGGILVVQGGPGTGKTAVALHRAAYLLYTHRFPLERQGVLVVGPNPTFLRYIEHVLPSLGESGVELSTVAGLVGHLGELGTEDPDTARLKGDPRMARVLARAVTDRGRPLRRTARIPHGRMFLELSPAASEQIVTAARRRPGGHNAKRRVVENLLWRHLLAQLARRVLPAADAPSPSPDEPSDDGGEPLTAAELGRSLRRVPEVLVALDRMWPVLTPQAFLHDLLGAPPLLELAASGILDQSERQRLHRPRGASLDEVAWTAADLPLIDEAAALLGPTRRARPGQATEELRTYGHVVVDEAQDLTPMQLRMLARRSLSGSMTVVGDMAQATGGWAPTSWSQVVEHLPARRGWRLAELTVNYRTPAEIMALAGRILERAAPGMRAPEAVRMTGEEPEVVTVDGGGPFPASGVPKAVSEVVAAQLRQLVRGGSGTVAVLAPESLVRALARRLAADGIPVGVAPEALDQPVSLLSVEEAKGLEFDVVVVVEPRRVVAEGRHGLRSVYVAVTRATQRLVVVQAEGLPDGMVGLTAESSA